MKTVIEMAREAGFVFDMTEPVVMVRYIPQDGFQRFAELVRADAIADEREKCAYIAEGYPKYGESIAEEIRARGVASIRSNT